MKLYRDPNSGQIVNVDEANATQVAALEALGYEEWDAGAIKKRADEAEKAKQEAAQKLAEAQKELAATHGDRTQPVRTLTPLNPNAELPDSEAAPQAPREGTVTPQPLNQPREPKKN